MLSQRPVLVTITEQIGHQVLLLQDESAFTDLQTVRARLETIRQFASQGLYFIEECYTERPKANGSGSVK